MRLTSHFQINHSHEPVLGRLRTAYQLTRSLEYLVQLLDKIEQEWNEYRGYWSRERPDSPPPTTGVALHLIVVAVVEVEDVLYKTSVAAAFFGHQDLSDLQSRGTRSKYASSKQQL